MPMKNIPIILFIAILSFGVNYVMALMGEPRSLWLMQLLGLM
ncbi:hypothetical protein ACPV5U_08595 [Vibrio mediterranei]